MLVKSKENIGNCKIEIAEVSSAAEISKFVELTFRQTFRGQAQYTDQFIDGYASKSFTAKYFRECIESSKQRIYLLRTEQVLAGILHIEERECPEELKKYNGLYLHRLLLSKDSRVKVSVSY